MPDLLFYTALRYSSKVYVTFYFVRLIVVILKKLVIREQPVLNQKTVTPFPVAGSEETLLPIHEPFPGQAAVHKSKLVTALFSSKPGSSGAHPPA